MTQKLHQLVVCIMVLAVLHCNFTVPTFLLVPCFMWLHLLCSAPLTTFTMQ